MAVLLLFLLTMDGLILVNQRSVLLAQTHKQVQGELELLGMLVSEALIKEDYVTVEIFVNSWAKKRKDVINASVLLDNGFALAEFSRAANNPVIEQYQRTVTYGNNRSILVRISEDISKVPYCDFQYKRKLSLLGALIPG